MPPADEMGRGRPRPTAARRRTRHLPRPPAIGPATLVALFGREGFDGRAAQRRMEPLSRGPRPPHADREPPRRAAALAYLYAREGRYRLPVTVRRGDLGEHAGQVSLPGGRPEPGEDLWRTALREAEEEVALLPTLPRLLGVLHPVYIPITHTELLVHVAEGPEPEALRPCPREVERIVEVTVDDLLDPARRRRRPLWIAGREIDVPYFDVEGLFLWGATAMALSELAERLRQAPGV